jgi:Non-classical export protein 1
MSAIAQPWLISKFFDPIFAMGVGFSAAALRIRREEKENNPEEDNSWEALWQKGVRMGKGYVTKYDTK